MRIKPSGGLIGHHTWSPLWDTVKALNRELHSIAIRPHPLVVEDKLAKECLPGDTYTFDDEDKGTIFEVDEDEVVRELPELVPEVEDKVVAPVIELMEIRYE